MISLFPKCEYSLGCFAITICNILNSLCALNQVTFDDIEILLSSYDLLMDYQLMDNRRLQMRFPVDNKLQHVPVSSS